jgi:flagellar basal-body rod protein FlgB
MPITDVPIFSMLRERMAWHQERQKLLAENVANADTPSFRPRDLAPLDFSNRPSAGGGMTLVRTDAAHIGPSGSASSSFEQQRGGRFEVRPSGNAVALEDEMLKVAANQMDYQAATSLYSRSLGLFKTALGKR